MTDDKTLHIDAAELTIEWSDSDTELVRALEDHDKDAFEGALSITFKSDGADKSDRWEECSELDKNVYCKRCGGCRADSYDILGKCECGSTEWVLETDWNWGGL